MRARASVLAALVAVACPRDEPPASGCPGDDDPSIEVSPNRGDRQPIEDGAEVPVFPPPQGGIFTELDVTLRGILDEEIAELRVDVERDDDGTTLAAQRYFGEALPLLCQSDGAFRIFGLPVAFDADTTLDSLDNVPATLRLTIARFDAPAVEAAWHILLTSTDY